MTGNQKTGDQGGILLETLIMLPVYLVLLSGLFWLGELCVIRQRLVGAERLRLWEDGTRLTNSRISQEEIFTDFVQGTSTRAKMGTGVDNLDAKFAQTRTTRDWGRVNHGYATLKTRRSEWSYGIVSFAQSNLWMGSSSGSGSLQNQGKDTMSMVSRGRIGAIASSCLLYRQDDTGRRDLGFSENTLWNDVYGEKWAWSDGSSFPAQGTCTKLMQYERNTYYNKWSI